MNVVVGLPCGRAQELKRRARNLGNKLNLENLNLLFHNCHNNRACQIRLQDALHPPYEATEPR